MQQFAAPAYAQQQGFPAPHTTAPYTPVSHFAGEPVIYRDIPSRWGTPSVWALALSPVIAMLAVLAALIVQGVRQNPQPHLVLAIVFLVSLLSLLFAVIDRRALLSFGYPEPAHWAWVFLTPLAYLIVRYVRTRAQAGVGGAPLWTHIALVVTLPFTVGIFSAIAIPVFLNQQGAAVDAQSRAISSNTEVAIISELVATGSQFTTVTCPEDIEFTPGGTFQCTVSSDSGEMSVTTVTFGETEYDITFTDPAF